MFSFRGGLHKVHSITMDEGDVEDVTAVGQPEDILPQGKRLLESGSMLDPQERVILREGDLPRSSIQQFVDIFHGKEPISAVNIVGTSSNYQENSEGMVQELTLGHCNSDRSVLNESEMMETIFNECHHENQPGDGIGPGSSRKYATNNEKFPTTSMALENLRPADVLTGQPFDQNANVGPGQSTYDGNDAVLRNVLPTGGMRMKIISKSSGFGYPEYFVKSTLKGKGVIYRGPISAGAEIRRQNIVKDATPHTTCDPLVNVTEKSAVPSIEDTVGFDLGASEESVNDGVSLREWLNSGQRNLLKVDCLLIFKQILDLVYAFHLEGKVLVDLRPSCFRWLPSRKVVYCGRISVQMEMESLKQKEVQRFQALKRPSELGRSPYFNLGAKHLKLSDNMNFHKMKSQFQLGYGLKPVTVDNDTNLAGPGASRYELECPVLADSKTQGLSSSFLLPTSDRQLAFSAVDQLEAKWYRSPEEVSGSACTCSSNIYCLGVLLFELLSSFDSGELHAVAMSDLRQRILPPNFLSENPKEAGFCLWLLHPKPSLRPKARDILHSEVVSGCQASCADDNSSTFRKDEGESELLLHFLMSTKEQKEKHASKLLENLGCIQADIQELEKRRLLSKNTGVICSQEDFLYATESGFLSTGDGLFDPVSDRRDSRFMNNVAQLESAYFSTRSQVQAHGSDLIRPDRDVLKSRESWYSDQSVDENQKPLDCVGELFDGLCKYARYKKLEVCGTVRNRDITNSTNVICSLSFDRDEDYFAAAGVSKKIKIFDFQALCDNSVDIHYPVIEMSNRSKLSSVCWNNYIRNYLASTDYDGIVKLWDASTGQAFLQFIEHEKRAWSVDFSQLDPTKLASGGDDCSVKLWSINERNCLHTIWNIANVCCVQFSAHSSHLLAFGSADYKIYCYDLRNANVPWCILTGHEKAVSYVKFVDSETIASASTDNTLKLWDLNRSSSVGLSNNASRLTLSGHTNEKNFVGLSVGEGYIACGSETNEVYTYYKSLPTPITSHKFGSIDPISGKETDNDNGQFVSSVCWKGKSNMLVAANSSGCIKVLRLV